MFCESYRKSLTEAAVRGEDLSGAPRLHAAACVACREALDQERALLRAIDGALQTVANAEVPASLVPRVRAQIAAPSGKASWRTPVLVFATALLVVGASVLSPRLHWPATQRLTVAKEPARAAPVEFAVNDGEIRLPAPSARAVRRRFPIRQKVSVAAIRAPFGSEVLVSPEEQAGLRHYAALLRTRSLNDSARATAARDDDSGIRPLEIAEIDLKQLAIDPLENGGSN